MYTSNLKVHSKSEQNENRTLGAMSFRLWTYTGLLCTVDRLRIVEMCNTVLLKDIAVVWCIEIETISYRYDTHQVRFGWVKYKCSAMKDITLIGIE